MNRCYDKELIINFLTEEDEISNLNIIAIIKNFDGALFKSSIEELEIYVDDIKNPNCVVVKEYDYWHYIYARNEKYLDLLKRDYFDKNLNFGVSGSDEKVFKKLKEGRNIEWEEHCILLWLDKDEFKLNESELDITDAIVEDAKIIDDYYTFKDETSYEFIKDDIKNRPSSVHKINGDLVSWVLIHRDNSIGIMYTKEEYRGKNLAYELSMDLLNKVIVKNQIPYIHIGVENDASFRLAEKCGFKKYKPIFWFGINDEK